MVVAMCAYHEMAFGEPDPDCEDCIEAQREQAQKSGEVFEQSYRGDGL